MDSISQMALGAAVSVAVAGRRVGVVRAACWGAVVGTLPDLDTFLDHGDPVRDMTLHRAESHALFFQTLVAPLLAALIARVHRQGALWRWWWLAVWLALVTHPLLDVMTVYGTQLARPFSAHPYGVGSVFIIDPLYTLPLLVGLGVVLCSQRRWRWRANLAGLALSTLYLAWGVAAQAAVREHVTQTLQARGETYENILVTPTPFNSLLWRVVVVQPDAYLEGFHSMLSPTRPLAFSKHARGMQWYAPLRTHDPVARLAAFSHGFFALQLREDGRITIRDLRMGQEPAYFFTFVVAQRGPDGVLAPQAPVLLRERPPFQGVLRRLRERL